LKRCSLKRESAAKNAKLFLAEALKVVSSGKEKPEVLERDIERFYWESNNGN
jgi:hypothetical protein